MAWVAPCVVCGTLVYAERGLIVDGKRYCRPCGEQAIDMQPEWLRRGRRGEGHAKDLTHSR